MSQGTLFLEYITSQIRDAIHQIGERIDDEQRDIENMHAYYWDNYTEMDQYGYENFDNQQALLNQVNAKTEDQKKRRRLQKMADAPFFGSVDFVYDDDDESADTERFYIGIGNFSANRGGVPLIYDWRAPVSGLFYDYDKGEACYEAPGGLMHGQILSKWQYKIRRGRMIYEFESDVKIDDDILKEELGKHGDTSLKNIVRTIQKEQNAIIRNTKDRIMVIQGAAGSGKTSIALHRIAYLLYHDRKHLKSSNVLILSPNSVFSDYISHILPELGEENILEMSFDLFAYRELNEFVGECEDRCEYLERLMQNEKKGKKQELQIDSRELTHRLEGFLLGLEDELMEFRKIDYHGFSMDEQQIMDLFYLKFPDIPLLSRMDEVMDYFVDSYETLHRKTLPEEELLVIREKFERMYRTKDLYVLYQWFLEEQGRAFDHRSQEKEPAERTLWYDDVYPVLYMKMRLFTQKKRQVIRHLIIDEMQDYSYLQYRILSGMFDCNMTILGDKNQSLTEKETDVTTFLPSIFGKQIRKIELNKSYRNTVEIAEYAESVNSISGIEYLRRHGKPVVIQIVSSREEAISQIRNILSDKDEQLETAAVLSMTIQEAHDNFMLLSGETGRSRKGKIQDIPVSLMDQNSTSFERGVTVSTAYHAKGLEFDQVFVIGGDPESGFYPQFQYISATRALHELYVFTLATKEK